MAGSENRYTLIMTDDELEILRWLGFKTGEDNRANLVRNMLRDSPKVAEAMEVLDKPTAFQNRQLGGYRPPQKS